MLYNNILQFVEKNVVEVMEIAARVAKKHGKAKAVVGTNANGVPTRANPLPDSGLVNGSLDAGGEDVGFEIMANVVWAELGRALMDELGALIFAAGKPAEFKRVCSARYLSIAAIFDVEVLCVDRTMGQLKRFYPGWNI